MIIQCPNCSRRFDLQRRPPALFTCPKCKYTVPFDILLNGGSNAANESKPGTNPGSVSLPTDASAEKTRVVDDLQDKTHVVNGLGMNSDKTRMVESLQVKSRGMLMMTFQGRNYGVISLPHGNFYNLGRNSPDSSAQVKLTPDMAMSRIHAGMRTVTSATGQVQFQITSAKNENPVYVNEMPVPKGKPCTLRSGDKIRMGETQLLFKQM